MNKIELPKAMKKTIRERADESAFVNGRSLFGINWANYYVMLGARQAGKSYLVTEMGVKRKLKLGDGMKWYWLRLTEASKNKLLNNDAAKLIDPDIRRRFDLDLERDVEKVYYKDGDEKKELVTVLALSTFYNDKGSAYFDKDFDGEYLIVLDEMNREKSEKNTFDIVYNFKNQLENLIRNSGSKQAKAKRVRVVLIGNTLSEASDILLAFEFLPEPGKFGRYRLKRKKCVIDYLPLTEAYKKMREDAVVDILKSSDESTFKNEVRYDASLIQPKRRGKPETIIKFKDDPSVWYTLWTDGTIRRWNKERLNSTIAMRRYLQGEFYVKDKADAVIQLFDSRSLKFDSFYTQECFRRDLRLLKPQR